MPESKSALIVANWEYRDTDLRQLVAPANDAEALAGILRDPIICGFEVTTILNRPCREMSEEIERFFLNRRRDDLLLLYFSCHGIKDDDGQLYFTSPDTRLIDHSRPMRSTALSADFVRSVMHGSNSRRQVLMLDCCYSGAFAGAMMSKGDKSAGIKDQFQQGRGLVVMTASDAIQYSFEGDKVEGEAVQSVFTRTLIRGIQTGEADLDRDGTISLDELYDYVYQHVVEQNPNQRPRKWTLEVEGRIVVAQSPVVRPAELPEDLHAAIISPLFRIRMGAVQELGSLLDSGHRGIALAAREALKKLADDDSRQVSAVAEKILGITAAKVPPLQSPEIKPTFSPITAVPEAGQATVRAEASKAPPLPPSPAPEIVSPIPPAKLPPANVFRALSRLWVFPAPYVVFILLILGGIYGYRWWHRPGQSTQQSAQQQNTSANQQPAAAINPVVLPRPPFDYYLAGTRVEDSKVRLVEVSEKSNKITDEEEWFGNNDLALPDFIVPNPFVIGNEKATMHEKGKLPQQIPLKQGDDILTRAIKQGSQMLSMYGHDFGSGRYLTGFDLASGKADFAFDFRDFILPPKYLDADRDFVNESLNWATLKDNVLYVSNGHSTYAKSSYGLNAYLSAIDAGSGRLLWRSAPLISNSENFLLYRDAIITGYGFTAEPHFLYVVNQKDGRVVQTIKVKKSPEYILNKGDTIFVRTYDTDYVFKASNEGELGQRLPGKINAPNQTNAPYPTKAPYQMNAPNQMKPRAK
jgi:hypothetical protein